MSLGVIFGFLATECGWTHKYILENLTIDQVRRYYEVICESKMRDTKINIISNMYASAHAFGSIKKEDFNKFLQNFDNVKKPKDFNIQKNLDKLKLLNSGGVIEEN